MTTGPRAPAKFARRDVAEIVVGACVMAFPVATTGELGTSSKLWMKLQATWDLDQARRRRRSAA